ncbi:hypothetical protein [Thalassotalea eurytherma]|uniref:Uncharacterized protein n=1 Tax=Thalassotalea eurytherma TaxID=1144278 RepID=A0ABQ6GY70_9GAMM|nr:hypothetical protein [Thalassotalea eurytherma]GLX80893.1 hypothetical protein theurythT_03450 [Thalassotalea eurytherma]
MLGSILKTMAFKLLTEKVIIKITLSCCGYLVKKTDNKLDDELFETVKGALE